MREKKVSWRRLTIGTVVFLFFSAAFVWAVFKGADYKILDIYGKWAFLIGLFTGGYITATDILDRIRKRDDK
jgi:hypothetical protein